MIKNSSRTHIDSDDCVFPLPDSPFDFYTKSHLFGCGLTTRHIDEDVMIVLKQRDLEIIFCTVECAKKYLNNIKTIINYGKLFQHT